MTNQRSYGVGESKKKKKDLLVTRRKRKWKRELEYTVIGHKLGERYV